MTSTSRLVRALLALSALLIALVAGALPATAADLVTVEGATSATLPPRATAAVTFPVTPADGVDPATLTARVVRVRLGSEEVPLDEVSVSVRVEPAIPAVVLEVEADELEDTGSYEILVSLQAGAPATPEPAQPADPAQPATPTTTPAARQLLTLTLTREPVTLVLPTALEARRTIGLETENWPEWLMWMQEIPGIGASEDMDALTAETSATSRIVTLRARQTEARAPFVTVTVPGSLPAGPTTPIDLAYEISSTSPGTETRTVQLSSPQMAAPAAVTFTVVTRLAPALLGLVLLLGVLLGLAVRTALPAMTNRITLLRERESLRTQIEELIASTSDPDFLAVATARLETLAGRGTTTQLRNRVSTTRTEVTAAWRHLEQRLKDAATSHDELRTAVRDRPHLPASFTAPLAPVTAALDAAEAALGGRNAADAAAHLTGAASAVGVLRSTVDTWLTQAGEQVANLAETLNGRTEGSLSLFHPVLDGLTRLLAPKPAAADGARPTDAAAVTTGLEVVNRVTGYARPQLRAWGRAVAAEARQVVSEVGGAAGVDTAEITKAADALDPAAVTDPDDVPTALAATTTAIRSLLAAYRDVLVRQLQGGAAVEGLLTSGDVLEAARTALPPPPAPSAGARAGSPTTAPEPSLDEGTVPEETPEPAPLELPPGRRGLSPERALLAAAAFGVSVLQFVIATAVVLVTGYALFLPEWLGTYPDLVKAFTWAFAVDTSLAGLTLLLTQVRASAAAPPADAAVGGAD